MLMWELKIYIDVQPNGKETVLKAIDKLLLNAEGDVTGHGDRSTHCSATCSKRSVYEIFELMKLIEITLYDEQNNDKYFKVINRQGLLDLKEKVIADKLGTEVQEENHNT